MVNSFCSLSLSLSLSIWHLASSCQDQWLTILLWSLCSSIIHCWLNSVHIPQSVCCVYVYIFLQESVLCLSSLACMRPNWNLKGGDSRRSPWSLFFLKKQNTHTCTHLHTWCVCDRFFKMCFGKQEKKRSNCGISTVFIETKMWT